MISFIKGQIEEITEDSVIVDNNGMGYELKCPQTVLDSLPAIGSDVKFYTYLYVREDLVSLFGFLTKDSLDVFKLLIAVSGIGPKGALGILSKVTPDELRLAVLNDDVKLISSAPGIGAKTAGKLIIELKDKLKIRTDFLDSLGSTTQETSANSGLSSIKNNVLMLMVALGYTNAESLRALKQVEITEGMSEDDILTLALKKIN